MRLSPRLGVLGLLGLALLVFAGPVAGQGSACEFRLGFKTLHDLLPEVVGQCLENERFNPANGNAEQRTTGGLLVWRKADNWTAFTDGSTTWINGPLGLQSRPNEERFTWETDVTQPPPEPTPSSPSPPPGSAPLIARAVVDAAGRAGVDRAAVQVVRVEARDWSDASLGCPQPGMMYAQVITPGFLIVLEANGQRYEYHTDRGSRVVLC